MEILDELRRDDGLAGNDTVLAKAAAAVAQRTGPDFTDAHVAYLCDHKLAPMGVATYSDGSAPAVRKANPFLALRFRVAVLPAPATRALGGALRWLFRPAVMTLMPAAAAVSEAWAFGARHPGVALEQTIMAPAGILAVLGLVLASTAFHEIGHATACRYGGARPGAMGYAAATAVLSGRATGTPKSHDGLVEAIRVLRITRRSAVKARTQAMNQIRGLLVTAPALLRGQFTGLMDTEIAELDTELRPLVKQTARQLLDLFGVGTDTARQLAAPTATASTAAATEPRTTPCTPSCWSECASTNAPAPTSNAAPPKDDRRRRSFAASPNSLPQLDIHRSIARAAPAGGVQPRVHPRVDVCRGPRFLPSFPQATDGVGT